MLSSPAAAAAVVLCLALDDCASISNAKLPAKLPATFRARARKIPFTCRAFSVVQCAYSLERALSESGGSAAVSRQPPRSFIHLFFPRRNSTVMAKTIATILGVVFILVGIVGFISHDFLGTHLTMAHNLVHIVSGALALYFGLAGSLSAARLFCIIFGIVYGLLGLAGFALGWGKPDNMLAIDDLLMLGTADHVIHILLGIVFLVGGFLTRADISTAG